MKISEILNEMTAGGVATVAMPMGAVIKRAPGSPPKKKKKKKTTESSISEISFAHDLGDLNISEDDIIAGSTSDGTIDQKPVMVFKKDNDTLYFFTDEGIIQSLVLLSGNNLKAIKNVTGQSGMVFALVNYIVSIKNTKIHISSDEPLTTDGFNWIAKIIKHDAGLKVTDGNGEPLSIEQLKDEWENAKDLGGRISGDTEIIISESSIRWKKNLQENETRLIPYRYFNLSNKKKITEADGADDITLASGQHLWNVVFKDGSNKKQVAKFHADAEKGLEDIPDEKRRAWRLPPYDKTNEDINSFYLDPEKTPLSNIIRKNTTVYKKISPSVSQVGIVYEFSKDQSKLEIYWNNRTYSTEDISDLYFIGGKYRDKSVKKVFDHLRGSMGDRNGMEEAKTKKVPYARTSDPKPKTNKPPKKGNTSPHPMRGKLVGGSGV